MNTQTHTRLYLYLWIIILVLQGSTFFFFKLQTSSFWSAPESFDHQVKAEARPRGGGVGAVAVALSVADMTVGAMNVAEEEAVATIAGQEEGLRVWGKLHRATAPQGIPP